MTIMQRNNLGFPGRAIAYDSDHQMLYVVPNGKATGAGHHGLAFRVAADGKLTRKSKFKLAHGYDYLSIDLGGRYLLGASYFEGHVDVYAIDTVGLPSRRVATRYENRDKAHSIRTDPSHRFAYVPYVKDQNALYQYAFDAKSGKLAPLDPPQAKVAAGAGPRHIVFHPAKPYVYFSNEQQLGVSAYRVSDRGTLELVQVCDALDTKPAKGIAASDIVITPDGRFIYASVRGFTMKPNAVFCYEVLDGGRLKALGKTETDDIPWALGMAPNGRTLFVSATRGGTLTAYAIDAKGELEETASLDWGRDFRDLVVIESGSQ